jgi:hypothetical protein
VLWLSILLGIHSPCIDIEVWIDLDRRDVQPCQYKSDACQYARLILRPSVLSRRPVEEAVTRAVSPLCAQRKYFSSERPPAHGYISWLMLETVAIGSSITALHTRAQAHVRCKPRSCSHDSIYLTYNTLLSLVRCDQNWQYNAAHLPHAADYTSRHKNVLHCRGSAVWGRGRKKSQKLRRGPKSFVSPVASVGAVGPVWHVRGVFLTSCALPSRVTSFFLNNSWACQRIGVCRSTMELDLVMCKGIC